jgi:AAA domain
VGEIAVDQAAPNVTVVPAHRRLADIETTLVREIKRESFLRRALKGQTDAYDIVLIDCPPNLGLLTVMSRSRERSSPPATTSRRRRSSRSPWCCGDPTTPARSRFSPSPPNWTRWLHDRAQGQATRLARQPRHPKHAPCGAGLPPQLSPRRPRSAGAGPNPGQARDSQKRRRPPGLRPARGVGLPTRRGSTNPWSCSPRACRPPCDDRLPSSPPRSARGTASASHRKAFPSKRSSPR